MTSMLLAAGLGALQAGAAGIRPEDRVIERFLRYVTIDTHSSETSGTLPSTPAQTVFARQLADELKGLGAKDVFVSEGSFVYVTLPASAGREDEPPLGFLAHLDTSSEAPGANVRPRRVTYAGGVLPLGTSGRSLDPAVFPELGRLVGKELIVTDGTTLLGADDKLGVAILMTLAETLLAKDAPSHREIRLCLTPDEEIGAGLHGFDPVRFGAKIAYTVDGSEVDVVMTANFNAAAATLEFRGVSVHPGTAKGVMVNALKLATAFVQDLPAAESPERTSGREGFYHPTSLSGNVAAAKLSLLVRDHDAGRFEARKRFLKERADAVNARYGAGTVSLTVKDQYRNMEEGIGKVPELVEAAKAALRSEGLEPRLGAIRGGTDGATLTAMGIPCPDIGTGGRNFHGECEYAIVEEVEKSFRIVLKLSGM